MENQPQLNQTAPKLQEKQEIEDIIYTENDVQKSKFQIFQMTKQYELSQHIYPVCIQDCRSKERRKNNLVFQRDELECVNNCVQKYRTSLNLLISHLTLKSD